MRKNKKKKLINGVLISLILLFGVSIFYPNISSVESQSREPFKNTPVPSVVEPGDDVKVTLRVPGKDSLARQKTDTMLVMDVTGSMSSSWSDGTKWDAAQAALRSYVDSTEYGTEEWDKSGLVVYATCVVGGGCGDGGGGKDSEDLITHAACESCPAKDPTSNGLLPMDAAGKSSLGGFVDTMPRPRGSTPIGAGLELANRQLVSFARPGVQKYVLLASDGRQNNWPGPYDPISAAGSRGGAGDQTPLQKAISNGIRVVTIGVGKKVDENLLKDLACKTDSECTAANPDNNPTNPRAHFFAPDDTDLAALYQVVQNLIRSDFDALMFDELNSSVFDTDEGAVDIEDWEIWEVDPLAADCTTGTEITEEFTEDGDFDDPKTIILDYELDGAKGLWVNFGKIPVDKDMCVVLTVTVRDDVEAGIWDVDASGDCGGVNGFVGYIPLGGGLEQAACINQAPLSVLASYSAWIQTKGGAVGAIGDIDVKADSLPSGDYNASYVVIAGKPVIENFTSAKDWLVRNYSFSPESWELSSGIYADLFDLYRNRNIRDVDLSNPNNVISKISEGILVYNPLVPGVEFDDPAKYTGGPSVIFINGNLTIKKKIAIQSNGKSRGLIFIVNGSITVNSGVSQLDGMYVSTGEFSTGSSSTQLKVGGALIAFGGLELDRSLELEKNKDTAAEVINYQSAYLWLFRNIVGETVTDFKELTP